MVSSPNLLFLAWKIYSWNVRVFEIRGGHRIVKGSIFTIMIIDGIFYPHGIRYIIALGSVHNLRPGGDRRSSSEGS